MVRPDEKYRETFLKAMQEFQDEGLSWWSGGDLENAEQDFAGFAAMKRDHSFLGSQTGIPKTHLWAIANENFVGRIAIFHSLNDELLISGGHIGYDTVPSFRGRGIATEMLRQALPAAKSLGLKEVLLTCDDTNAASIRTIEKNGGVLRETKKLDKNGPLKRYYWIDLLPSPMHTPARKALEREPQK
ncbi:MAG: GNAT family N-acetyltransferase [Deltaproteobacteria bacterium]|nr:GNAT family N-acetyltransferase [Deltaproteobacteria bacterium]